MVSVEVPRVTYEIWEGERWQPKKKQMVLQLLLYPPGDWLWRSKTVGLALAKKAKSVLDFTHDFYHHLPPQKIISGLR